MSESFDHFESHADRLKLLRIQDDEPPEGSIVITGHDGYKTLRIRRGYAWVPLLWTAPHRPPDSFWTWQVPWLPKPQRCSCTACYAPPLASGETWLVYSP